MPGPRLGTLDYRLVSEVPERWDLSALEDHSFEVGDFECTIKGDTLNARPQTHFEDEQSGRAALEPHLETWAAVIELESQVPIRFRYGEASVFVPNRVDEEGNVTHTRLVSGAVSFEGAGSFSVKTALRTLPAPAPFMEPPDL